MQPNNYHLHHNIVDLGLLVSGSSDYPNWVMTVQLECFVGNVCFIRVFEWSSVYKCMGINYPNLSEHIQFPMSSDKQGSTVFTNVLWHNYTYATRIH